MLACDGSKVLCRHGGEPDHCTYLEEVCFRLEMEAYGELCTCRYTCFVMTLGAAKAPKEDAGDLAVNTDQIGPVRYLL